MTSQTLSFTTPTSPNTVAVTTQVDGDGSTSVAFQDQRNGAVAWAPVVSVFDTTSELEVNIPPWSGGDPHKEKGPVWEKGLEVRLDSMSPTEYRIVLVKGSIIDEYQVYTLADITLGVFPFQT